LSRLGEILDRRTVLRYLSLCGGAIAYSAEPLLSGPANGSASVVYNQNGYLPGGEKIASVLARDGSDHLSGQLFQIYSEHTGRPVFQGPLTALALDAVSGDRVARADFSRLTTPGAYRFVLEGIRSQPFLIGNDVYSNALMLSMRAFYGQRCGRAVDLGSGYQHTACHAAGAYHRSSGRQGPIANCGGWHDAGDYGRYMVSSGITTGTLLWAWELYPRALRSLSLRIPESGGKLPDYLAEIRWNLEWMLSLQDGDGGVWHKQTSEQFCGVVMPQDDSLTSFIIGTGAEPFKSTCATADLAAVMAIAARCYSAYDGAFANRCLIAAGRAWAWAAAHPDVPFANPEGISTGAYGDSYYREAILWAAAELWRTTGHGQYEEAFMNGSQALPVEASIQPPSWSHVAPLAYWTYALAERQGASSMRGRVVAQTMAVAQGLLTRRQSSGFGNTLAAEDYVWGSNGVGANQSLLLLIANHFQPKAEIREAMLGNLHYLLGRNCFGVSWVTHVGTNPFLRPHHRPSMADHVDAPWPGLLSGGPNAKPSDNVGLGLRNSPPMRMWVDDQTAFSLNEIAINWNAPLVFLLAAANDHP
jgi:endoglucanase